MSKVIAICGKICSGKTHYCKAIQAESKAVLLSTDEVFFHLFHHQEAERHDKILADIKGYLHKKALEITAAGCDVILDWGFWQAAERRDVQAFYDSHSVTVQWHYIDISDEDWLQNIRERNDQVSQGLSTDYYVDEGLRQKLLSQFEIPQKDEIDLWHTFQRDGKADLS